MAQPLVHVLGELDLADRVGGFHPGGDVDSVAPHVVEEPAGADHPGHHRSGGDAHAQRHRVAPRITQAGHRAGDVQRQRGDGLDMVVAGEGHTADHHVAVAGRLDLLQTMAVHQPVEGGVEPVEEAHQFGGVHVAGAFGVSGDVGEQHRGVVVPVGDGAVCRVFQLSGHRGGQDVGQQRLGPVVLDLHRLLCARDLPHRVPDRRQHQDACPDGGEHETRVERPPRLQAGVRRDQELQRDHQAGAGGHRDAGQREVLDAEHQHCQRRRDQIVELHPGIGADLHADERQRCVGDDHENRCGDNVSEPMQPGDGQEHPGQRQVDQTDVQHPVTGHRLEDAQAGGQRRGDPGGEVEYSLRPGDRLGPVLVAGGGTTLQAFTVRPPETAVRQNPCSTFALGPHTGSLTRRSQQHRNAENPMALAAH